MVKIIENRLPMRFISELSKKEANSRKPVYKIHKWFGRKTDAIFRSILLSLVLKEEDYHSFDKLYFGDNSNLLKDKIILDPFMGGGITLVNTLRLGGKAIGIDVNPVAWFITKNELQIPDKLTEDDKDECIDMLKEEFENIYKKVGKEIEKGYKTYIYDGDRKKLVDIMYVFWIKTASCPKCKRKIKFFPKYNITNITKQGFINYNICPNCDSIVMGNESVMKCESCGNSFQREKGTYKGRRVYCNGCNSSWNIINDIIKKTEDILDLDMFAIEYYDSETGRKGFKVPDEFDIESYNFIKSELHKISGKDGNIPREKMPKGFNTGQMQNHNYMYWKQMFNPRQLYYLSLLLREIDMIENQKIKELFLCVFSNTLNANNMFCIYNSQLRKLEPIFGDHHMAPVVNPVENNLWGARFGRGTFVKNFNTLMQGKIFNFEPYERKKINNKTCNTKQKNEKFIGKLTDDFYKLLNSSANSIIKCSSAENISFIPSNSIDAVVTDPPYYSAINYGEISEFFYIWQKKILSNTYEFYNREHLLSENEITVNQIVGINIESFRYKLENCFKEIKRVLKKGAPFVFTYNNSNPEGWAVLGQAIFNSGFGIKKTFPVHTELRAGLIDKRREKMNYDLVIVAVEEENHSYTIDYNLFTQQVNEEFVQVLADLGDNNLRNIDRLVIISGKILEVYSKYRTVATIDKKILELIEIFQNYYNEDERS